MKFTSRDPETNKERTFENNYEYRIVQFKADNDYNFWDNEIIEYAIKLKEEIISNLDNNSSRSDKIRVGHIKWVEKYIHGIHDFMVEHNFEIPIILEKQKTFVYKTGKNKKVGRPKGRRNKLTIQKYNCIRDKYYFLTKTKKLPVTIKESAGLIRSQLLGKKPEFWNGNVYSLNTIIDIIKKQKWGD